MHCIALPEGEAQVENESIMETCGFMAPEVALSGVYLEKSDGFSFDLILFNLLTGKRYYGFELDYMPSCIRNHTINEIVDTNINCKLYTNLVSSVLEIM